MRAADDRPRPVQGARRVQFRQQRLVQPLPAPASCQSRSRRQQVIPEPNPSSTLLGRVWLGGSAVLYRGDP